MVPIMTSENDLGFDPEDWKPNMPQAAFLSAWLSKKYPVVSSMMGWGTGKTRLVAYLMHASHEESPGDSGIILTDSLSRGARTIAVECAKILAPLGWTYHHTHKGIPAPHWLSPPLKNVRSRVWVLSWKRPSTRAASANSLEGPSVSYAILDEANQFAGSSGQGKEVLVAMLGRVRAGNPGRIAVLGKPTYAPYWKDFAEERGGWYRAFPTHYNRENIPDFQKWVSSLSSREYRENILAQPQPPVGSIFSDWIPEEAPTGNLAPKGWKPQEWHTIHATFDFGVRHPAGLLIAHDPSLNDGKGADVVFGEYMPDGGSSVFDVCRALRRGIPGVFQGVYPAHRMKADGVKDKLPLHAVFGDRAGRNRRDDQAMTSAIGDVEQVPSVGGLGSRVITTDDPKRVHILGGIKLLWRLMCSNEGERRLLCTHELWHHGQSAQGRTFARSINDYRWASSAKDQPDKTNGADHACDALRYWAVNARWPSDVGIHEAKEAFRGFTQTVRPSRSAGGDR